MLSYIMDLNNRQTVTKKTPHFFMSKQQKKEKASYGINCTSQVQI